MRRPAILVLAAISILLFQRAGDGGQKSGSSQPVPVWESDLRKFGYADPVNKKEVWSLWFQQKGVAFTDSNVVAPYFVFRNPAGKLSVRGRPQPSDPFQLHAVFFDASTGSLITDRQWPTWPSLASKIIPTHDGRFLVRAGDGLALYSPGFELLAERSVRSATGGSDQYWEIWVSPAGQSLFLYRRVAKNRMIEILDPESLAPINSWKEVSLGPFSAADGALVEELHHAEPNHPDKVLFRPVGQPSHTIYSNPYPGCLLRASVLTNEWILIENCYEILVISKEGKTTFMEKKEDFGQRIDIAKPRSSRDGRRFAIAIESWRGGYFDTSRHLAGVELVIYSLPATRRIYSLKVRPSLKGSYDFALSPDGDFLAVMVDGILKLYRLPGDPPS